MVNSIKRKVSIAIQTNKSPDQYKVLGKLAEDLKFDSLTVYNDLLYQPAWIPLALIAQVTKSIQIGVASVNPFTCHPLNIVGNISLINEISHGRAYLGLSRGAWLDYLHIYPKAPIQSLYDSILAIKHLLHQSKEPLLSKYFPLQGGDSLRWTIPYPDVPILLGSWGEKTISKCKNLISEIKLGGTANPDLAPVYRKLLQSDEIGITFGCVTVVDEDSDKAKSLAKKEVALYLPVIAKLDKTLHIESEILEKIILKTDKFDYDGAAEFIDDFILEKFSFSGTPEEITEQVLKIFNKGGTRVEFGTPHGIESIKGINLLGKQVLPRIRERLGFEND